jgi:hypothetical protein
MIIKVSAATATASDRKISLRCPSCRQRGTFDGLSQVTDAFIKDPEHAVFLAGQRRCPNPGCSALIFFVADVENNRILITYPPERIDFDPSELPARVISALEEAITCHANRCFVASALMVRKTLEELCRDREAPGDDLKKRIRALGAIVVLPRELLDGLDDLRLLGNDAAHVESRQYDKVGKEEVEAGIAFTKEVLKAVYQYSALLGKLRALKKAPGGPE